MSGQSIEVPHLKRAEVTRFAQDVRRSLKINDDYFPIIEVLELVMPLLIDDYVFGVKSKREMGNDHGLTVPSEKAIYLRSDVYNGAVNGNTRDRFTAAHELGHYLLHLNAPVKYHRTLGGKRLPAEIDSECQANLFAASLLMPLVRFRRCRSLNEASERFGVGKGAASFFNRLLAKERQMRILN